LTVTPDGLPLAYEVMPGNTSDKTTLRDFLRRIEAQYGKAGRTWVMDRGIPTEAVLAEMRAAETPTHYLVGTSRGRLSQMERDFLTKPWAQVRDAVQVKLVEQRGELYILARSGARRDKEQAMRRRRLKKLVKRLHELRQQKLTRDQLLIKLGAARKEAGPAAWRIIDLRLPEKDQIVTPETFGFRLNWQNLREARRREGSYLLRSNLTGGDPAQLWAFYLGPLARVVAETQANYNETVEQARTLASQISEAAQEVFDAKSERWQDSDNGTQVRTWIEQWEMSLDDIDLDLPEPLEEIDPDEHASALERASGRPAELEPTH
jgi:hypothetical protein